MTADDRQVMTSGALSLLMWLSTCSLMMFASNCDAPSAGGATPTAVERGEAGAVSTDPPAETRETSERPARSERSDDTTPRRAVLEVVAEYPHDPGAFTQGLLWHDGKLLESTGRYGESSLRLVEPTTGDVLKMESLDRGLFGEGLARVDDRLVQLTWRAGRALVWDAESFETVDEWRYNGQGWGLTWDGTDLVMSDGSSRLTFRDANDFHWKRTLEVTLDGRPLPMLNELEFVDGKVWANVWSDEQIVRIDPQTGVVDLVVDASGLLDPKLARYVDVLNGIAHDPSTGHFWITGKLWPRMFEVRIVE